MRRQCDKWRGSCFWSFLETSFIIKTCWAAMLGQTKYHGSSAVCLWRCSRILHWKSVLVQSDTVFEVVLWVGSMSIFSVSSSGNTVTHVLPETGWCISAHNGLTEQHDYIPVFFSVYFLVTLTFLKFLSYLKTCSKIGRTTVAILMSKVYATFLIADLIPYF